MKPALPADKALRRLRWFFPVVFLVLAFSIGTAGILFLRRQQINTRQAIQNELAAIADLKVTQIVNWRNERLDDARFFAKAFFAARDVQAFFSDTSSETTRAEILSWLMQLKAGDRYSQVALFDARLNPRLAIPPWTHALSPPMLALMDAAPRQQALFTGIIILVFLLVVVLSLIRDITQRKKTESALQSAKDFAENLIATANTMIVGLDTEGNITLFNQAAEEITGYQRAELAGRNWFEVLVPKDRYPQVWDEFHRLLSGGLPKHFENPILTKAGQERYIVWQNNERRELGRIVGTISFGMDMTGRKEMEDRVHQAELLQKANVELEERVQQRTAELAAANTELESFAFSVSHDLRAPLRGIDGWSLALLEDYDDQLDARAKGYLQTVRSETQRMGQLIDALLELSRVTRQDMQHITVNLSELAHGIAAELHRAESGRHVDFCIAPDLVVHGDPILLRAALDNLLGNAWKFTAQRSQARIEFGQTLREGQPVFFIRDNGAGFDMHNASRLFAPFQRLHRKDQFPGTGIGLATVRRILNRHLGRIWAEGEVDHGAVFFFTLGLSTAGKP